MASNATDWHISLYSISVYVYFLLDKAGVFGDNTSVGVVNVEL